MSFTNVCEALGGFFKLADGLPIWSVKSEIPMSFLKVTMVSVTRV